MVRLFRNSRGERCSVGGQNSERGPAALSLIESLEWQKLVPNLLSERAKMINTFKVATFRSQASKFDHHRQLFRMVSLNHKV